MRQSVSQWLRRGGIWLIWLPPIGAVAMGILMLNLALATDPGYVESAVPPLSKTSWRGQDRGVNAVTDAASTEQIEPEPTTAVVQ